MTTEPTGMIDSAVEPEVGDDVLRAGSPEPEAVAAGGPRALDIFDPRHRADPYPVYRALREAGRFHWLYPDGPRVAVITRYADCLRVLREPALGHVPMAESVLRPGSEGDEGLRSMLRANPPTHTRLRRLVSRGFTAGRIARFGPVARTFADDLLDAALHQGEVDLVSAYTRPVPLRVICALLGVPPQDEEVFAGWTSALTRALDPDQVLSDAERDQRTQATRGFADYFDELISKRRAAPADDLLSDLIAVQEEGDRLTGNELVDLCVLLLVAGYDTTVNVVANAALALARDPEQYQTLRARRDLVPAAMEETLRFEPAVHWIGRTALADVELAGEMLRPGDAVVAVVAAALRDPEAFHDPDRFDVTRYAGPTQAARHFGFGAGIHYCLGAPLARLEAEIMLTALLDRVGRIELAVEPPPYRPHLAVRGVSALPVRLTPA